MTNTKKANTTARTTTSGTTAQVKTDNGNTFATLLRTYEHQTRQRTPQTEQAYTTALLELAKACTFSVLKKLCNVGGTVTEQTKNISDTTKTIRTLRQSIVQDISTINRTTYASNNATALEYNKDGELVTVIKDKDLDTALTKLCATSFRDGFDLVNTAIITILDETAKAADISGNFMETPYNVRRLKKKVYIQDVSSLGGYETVQTTPIQEVYKAIRRDIESNRTMQIASNKYTYLESILTDTESDTETEIYRRLPKYSGLAYETTDINGKVTAITADTETVQDTDKIIEKLNLTAKEMKVLQLRQSGYGYKAIATYLGITVDNSKRCGARIREKATAIGFTPLAK